MTPAKAPPWLTALEGALRAYEARLEAVCPVCEQSDGYLTLPGGEAWGLCDADGRCWRLGVAVPWTHTRAADLALNRRYLRSYRRVRPSLVAIDPEAQP
jgi:hypothetical protein